MLFTKNPKQLCFCLNVSKQDIKMLCISLVYRKITIFLIGYSVFKSLDVELIPNTK